MAVVNLITGVPYPANSKHLPYELRNSKPMTINDNDRHEFVINVESLYISQRRSRLSMKEWIKQNREMIDAMMRNSK